MTDSPGEKTPDISVLKVGPKGRHVRIPEGWRLVRRGCVIRGDRYLNLETLHWTQVDEEDLGDPCDWIDYLIRRDNPPGV